MVEALTVPTQYSGDVQFAADYDSNRIKVGAGGQFSVPFHEIELTYDTDPHDYAQLKCRFKGKMVMMLYLDNHVARRLDVFLARHNDEHSVTER